MADAGLARIRLSTLRNRVQASGLRMERRGCNPGTASAHEVYDFVAANGRALFSVMVEDHYDAEGNRFEDDLS